MVNQTKARFKHRLGIYLITSLLVLVMSWEYQKSISASVVGSATAANQSQTIEIPEESMRLRILANSDSVQDQWLKREVRDQVVSQLNEWVQEMKTLEEAREHVKLSLPELEEIVGKTIKDRGFTYEFSVEYGQIEFPSKLYGNKLYPAGEYEGLLIKIGEAQGDNWWCVLFPPLCFVDFGTEEEDKEKESVKAANVDKDVENKEEMKNEKEEKEGKQVEVRFFLVELFLKIKGFFA